MPFFLQQKRITITKYTVKKTIFQWKLNTKTFPIKLLFDDNKIKMAEKKQKENPVGCTGEDKR